MKYEKGNLGLIIPVNTDDSYNTTTLHQIQNWQKTLPINDFKVSIKSCHTLLNNLHKSKIDPHERLQMLNIIKPTVSYLFESAMSLYKNKLSFNKSIVDLYRIVLSLHLELFNEYKLILEDLNTADSKLEGFMDVINLTLQQSCKIIFLSYENYHNPPAHIWLETHQLYSIAKSKSTELSESKNKGISQFTNITNTYKNIVLFALTNPLRYRRIDMLKLYYALEVWAPLLSFSFMEKNCLFKIDLGKDAPPHYCALDTSESVSAYFLLLDKVIERLENLANYFENTQQSKTAVFTAQEIALPKSVIYILLHTWHNVSQRQSARIRMNTVITTALGARAIYALAMDSQASRTTECENETDSTEENLEYIGEIEEINLDTLPLPEALQERGLAAIERIECTIIDKSEYGYCLKYKSETRNRPKSGEIIGLLNQDEHIKSYVQLAVIRWVQSIPNEKGLMGVELLALDTLPVTIDTETGGAHSQMEALLAVSLPEDIFLLITPVLRFKPAMHLILNDGLRTYTCVLRSDTKLTTCYSIWEISFFDQYPSYINTQFARNVNRK